MTRPCRNVVCLEEIPDLEETHSVIEDHREKGTPIPDQVSLYAFGYCSEGCEHACANREQIAILKREAKRRA